MRNIFILLSVIIFVNATTEREILFPEPPHCGVTYIDYIYEGEDTKPGEFPWIVWIKTIEKNTNNMGTCGGSLINHRWVLTAAHCIYSNSKYTYEISLGAYNRIFDPKAILREVKLIVVHPKYNDTTEANDIALILLETPVEKFSTYIKPICLPFNKELRENRLVGESVSICGWGLYNYSSTTETASILQKADVFVHHWRLCKNKHKKTMKGQQIGDKQLCALGTRRQDSGRGDSGGPLMFATLHHFHGKKIPFTYIAGITSYGRAQSDKDISKPGVYTRVGAYMDWIKKALVENY